MSKLELEIPEELVQSLKLPRDEVAARLKKELALRLKRRVYQLWKSPRTCWDDQWEFSHLLGEEEIPRHYDLEEFNKDLNTLEELIDCDLQFSILIALSAIGQLDLLEKTM